MPVRTGLITKFLLRCAARLLYRVQVSGWRHYRPGARPVLFIVNHSSWLDGILLYAWLPGEIAFAINREVLASLPHRFLGHWVRFFALGGVGDLSLKTIVDYLRQGEQRAVVIFPEGRITTSGALMKIYEGSGLIADRSRADIIPVYIDGARYSPFSYLRGQGPIRWFPRIRMKMLPRQAPDLPETLQGRARRRQATRRIEQYLREAQYQGARPAAPLFEAVRQAARLHGMGRVIIEQPQGPPLRYRQLLIRSGVLAAAISRDIADEPCAGLMLPNAPVAAVAFLALQSLGKAAAMLNFSTGAQLLLHCCSLASLRTVLTSRQFIEAAELQDAARALEEQLRVVYLEDLVPRITRGHKLRGILCGLGLAAGAGRERQADDPAVILFTSGSEARPKGVVLSHGNLLSNYAQVMCCVDFGHRDRIFSCLPLFHSFGLTGGLLIPLLAGMRIFLYPSPLHYRRIPDLVYHSNATVLFGTNTFLRAYARGAHQYDFHRLRYVVAGAEKLQEDTLQLWMEKFGIRIHQGYGVTETSPVISVNTPQAGRTGTVGRLMPAMQARLRPVEGLAAGGRLLVRGPNVMLGYLSGASGPGGLAHALPADEAGPGWYDTGDIADVDADGFIRLLGRARRFAKIGGEMVSLAAVETLAAQTWPDFVHAAVTVPDPRKGERILLLSTCPDAEQEGLSALRAQARKAQLGALYVPERVCVLETLPILRTGKLDYLGIQKLAESLLARR